MSEELQPTSLYDWASALSKFVGGAFGHVTRTLAAAPDSEFMDLIDRDGDGLGEPLPGGLAIILHGYNARKPSVEWCRDIMWESICEDHVDKPVFQSLLSPLMDYHCGTLREVASRAFDVVDKFVEKYPTMPVLIIGISAGGRVAAELSSRIRWSNNPVTVVTIASPLKGTHLVNFSEYLARRSCGEHMYEEFNPSSERQDEIRAIFSTLPDHHSAVFFYCTTDWTVYPPSVCYFEGFPRKEITACPHNQTQVHPVVLEFLETFKM